MPELLPASRTVHGGGFVNVLGNSLQRGQVQHHIKTQVAPEHHGGHRRLDGLGGVAPVNRLRGCQPAQARDLPDAVQRLVDEPVIGGKQCAEHHGNRYRGSDVGQKIDAHHDVARALVRSVNKVRQRNGDQVLRNARGQRQPQRIAHRLPEPFVLQREDKIVQADKLHRCQATSGLPGLKRQVERKHQREDAEHRKQEDERAQEYIGRQLRRESGQAFHALAPLLQTARVVAVGALVQ